MSLALALGAALAVACVVLVALPFLRDPDPGPGEDAIDALDPSERRLLELSEDRDRALAALKELEADHRAGRISDADYRAVIGPLRQEAAQALRAIDVQRGGSPANGANSD